MNMEKESERPYRILHGGVLADGTKADIAIDPTTGFIAKVGSLPPNPTDELLDCSHSVVIPTAVEPHAHLDKVLSHRHLSAMPVDLRAAIASWQTQWPTYTHDDFVRRATEAVENMMARGTTGIRSHVDVGTGAGIRGVQALIEVRNSFAARDLVDIQIVALVAPPYTGMAGAENIHFLRQAIDCGIDIVGGAPHLDNDPAQATAMLVSVAAQAGLGIDLHTDESVDPSVFDLQDYCELVIEHGIENAVASHCASLASQPVNVQRQVAACLARAGIAVTTMPAASLFFFGWEQPVGPPRGITAVRVLQEAGVTVAGGADNVQDHFFPLGRFDPLETAAMLGMAVHMRPEEAWDMCTAKARQALGLPSRSIEVGHSADLLIVPGRNLQEAIALADEGRTVIRRGRVISRTTTARQMTS